FGIVLAACGGGDSSSSEDPIVIDLSSLNLSTGALSPAFDPSVTAYSAIINADSITVIAGEVNIDETLGLTATITVNGQTVTPGLASGIINLNEGNNTITVFVRTSDGSASETYVITVYRPYSDNSLASLGVSNGATNYTVTSSGTNYSTTVPNSVTSVQVTPTVGHSAATVTVNGSTVASGNSTSVTGLGVGIINSIPIVVTAENGETETYDLQVIRQSNNSSLLNLQVVDETLSPVFNPATAIYTLTVDTPTIQVIATAVNGNATLTAGGISIMSGVTSSPIPVGIGNTNVEVVITSEDESQSETYTLQVYRESNIADLSALAMTAYNNLATLVPSSTSTPITLVPAFNPAITSYSATITSGYVEVTTTPSVNPANNAQQITVESAVVTSGAESGATATPVGDTTISIEVTAEDGFTTKTYTVNVRRQSPDATLSNLVLSSGTLDPAFDSGTDEYDADVADAVTSITITPSTNHPDATVTVDGVATTSGAPSAAISLDPGNNEIDIVVTAEDDVFDETYTVTVYRQSADSSLSALSLSEGTLTPVFDSLTTSYATGASVIGTSVTVTAITTDANATVMYNVNSGGESASNVANLNIDGNTIEVIVTSEDETSITTYTISVDRLSNIADLSALTLSSGGVLPAFTSGTLDYDSTQSAGTASVTVTPTLSDLSASMTVEGAANTSGVASAPIALTMAMARDIEVVVTAEDGVTQQTYTVATYRQSNDSTLLDLSLTMGELDSAFAPSNLSYGTQVDYLVPSVGVIPIATIESDGVHPGAVGSSITVESIAVESGETSEYVGVAAGGIVVINIDVTAEDGVSESNYTVTLLRGTVGSFAQQAYVKASDTAGFDHFGRALAISGDTLAVGAYGESASQGAVYVFTRNGSGTWSQQGSPLTGSGTSAGSEFGWSVDIDGDMLVVGAPNQGNGAAYVFSRSGTTWTQIQTLTAPGTGTDDDFGQSVSIDDTRLAVGAPNSDAGLTSAAGVVHVYDWLSAIWSYTTELNAGVNSATGDEFGASIALDDDAIVIGAPGESSTATGINGDDSLTGAAASGAAYVFATDNGLTWTQYDYIKALNTGTGDRFGEAVDWSNETVVVTAPNEDSDAVGVTPDHTTAVNSLAAAASDTIGTADSGAAYVFTHNGIGWTQEAYVKALNTDGADAFGASVAIEGDMLVIGANGEASAGTGASGASQTDNTAAGAGAVYTFARSGTTWTQQDYVKASNTEASDSFGIAVDLSGDTVASGANGDASDATGVGGSEGNNLPNFENAGAVYVFH
ncbi:MAG: cadherin-like beta sandwich domain-containing protein, partial [Pseudomonadota bacterium]